MGIFLSWQGGGGKTLLPDALEHMYSDEPTTPIGILLLKMCPFMKVLHEELLLFASIVSIEVDSHGLYFREIIYMKCIAAWKILHKWS